MSKLKCFFQPYSLPKGVSVALLLVRILMGVALIMHGWGKIQTPFSWMGPDAPVPGILQFLAALSEFGGGIALLLGLLTSLAMLGLFFTMAVAVHMHAVIKGDPFVGGYELAALYLVLAIMFIITGPGKFALDGKIFGNKSC
ncbi:DoxX family protein [Pseudobdellovibrio sp. HCB154]|uniref:DoxX family protein n=1 Tax=Pseudobdellovibrio sp. HCB154 TaxID=3386277 RepID=UPI003916F90A